MMGSEDRKSAVPSAHICDLEMEFESLRAVSFLALTLRTIRRDERCGVVLR
jgi:hypothetical protein